MRIARAGHRLWTLGLLAALLALGRQASAQSGAWVSYGPEGASVFCLAADPSNSSVVYAGTTRGISKSLDGGVTWQPVGTGLPSVIVATIAIDPTATSTLYAGTLGPQPGVGSTGIFKSTDGGQTWAAINNGLVDTGSGTSPVDVETIAIDPHNPSGLLAGTRFSDIFKSTDGGATWQARTSGGSSASLEVKAFQFHPSMEAMTGPTTAPRPTTSEVSSSARPIRASSTPARPTEAESSEAPTGARRSPTCRAVSR